MSTTWLRRIIKRLIMVLGLAAAILPQSQSLPVPVPLRRVSASYLGLGIADIGPEQAKALKAPKDEGVEVVAVERGEAGDAAGIQPQDVIVAFNDERVRSAPQFIKLVQQTPAGKQVKLVCIRNGIRKEIWVTTGALHAAREFTDSLGGGRVLDVPFPMMVWRNLLLGIESAALNDQMAQALGVKGGILVWAVASGSPAQRAGLRGGDVVIEFCGRSIQAPRDLGAVLQRIPASEDELSISAVRDHKQMVFKIVLDGEQ